ncbi:MAG: flagellar FlbD family protein [Ruminococcus sp.]|nr:flagellar FlbD family protein [Ruminococcus sp.]
MIKLTRMSSGTELLVNENFIETAEETPDTVVTMQNGHRYFVNEKVNEILDKILDFEKEKTALDGGR